MSLGFIIAEHRRRAVTCGREDKSTQHTRVEARGARTGVRAKTDARPDKCGRKEHTGQNPALHPAFVHPPEPSPRHGQLRILLHKQGCCNGLSPILGARFLQRVEELDRVGGQRREPPAVGQATGDRG
ncbi:unnamed protein product [Mycena citricolor]|uniref:Uncharacterized protein n=1 Tax=Mycena citricolor TaxID=2018698 RepID=A0AAD2HZH9_9AGAR|nr:unnamed protein product [Mycena citricolor]